MDRVESEVENIEDVELLELLRDWDRKRHIAVVLIKFCVLQIVMLLRILSAIKNEEDPSPESYEQRERDRKRLMRGLEYQRHCKSVIRMTPVAFHNLCDKLKAGGLLTPTKYSSVEEQVAKFLMILSHQTKNRYVSFFLRRSGETTSRHFHNVLRAIVAMEGEFLKQPNGVEVPPEICNDTRYFPYFKDCVGAIDGTHIRANVPAKDATRYRGRKDYPTQNVLAACNFDLTFSYVLPGWEGTASDSRIIKNALTREDNLIIPEGKYYLVDAGFMLRAGLLAPYRGVRYHLKEYSSCGPENREELFNLRHASLRNAIERTFGVLKKRFPIIGSASDVACLEDVLADGNTIIEKANSIMERSRPRIYSSEEIYTDVACQDFDEDLKLEALELLVNNQAYARVFFGMPMEARKRWLLRKMSVGN